MILSNRLKDLINSLFIADTGVAEIVECVRKYMEGSSQYLQSLSCYELDPPMVSLFLRIMAKQIKSSSQAS